MKQNFEEWLSNFRISISDYRYYVDFQKVYGNIEEIRIELNLLNSLIGSKNIEQDFEMLISRYPDVLKCIPILLAVRQPEIWILEDGETRVFSFNKIETDVEHYKEFMRKSGLFDLIENRLVSNMFDYVTGVEVGLDSNGRKNRGGHLMENLVEEYIVETGVTYYKEMNIAKIETKWGLDLSAISNNGKTPKRFDFVVKTPNKVYAIETNFYGGRGGGSKLNETARSYKMLAQESAAIEGFEFVWLTDGTAWNSARHNLEETCDVTDYVFSISDLEQGILAELFRQS